VATVRKPLLTYIHTHTLVDAGPLLMLNNLVEFMEQATDTCADTTDYIVVLASEG